MKVSVQIRQRAPGASKPSSTWYPKASAGQVPAIVPAALRSHGQPLDASPRNFQPRLWHDFSQVRVHAEVPAVRHLQAQPRHPPALGFHADILSFQRAVGNRAMSDLFQEANGRAVAMDHVPPIVDEVLESGTGHPLDAKTRSFMESRFGQDFSKVRVHRDEKATASAQALDAAAYAVGQDVVFGAERYAPHTVAGRRLLAHELAHVLQQTRGFALGSALEGAEAEATHVAERVVQRSSARVWSGVPVGVQRQTVAEEARIVQQSTTAAHVVQQYGGSATDVLEKQVRALENAAPVSGYPGLFALTVEGRTVQIPQEQLDRVRGEVHRALAAGVRRVDSRIAGGLAGHRYMKQIRKEQWFVGSISDVLGGVSLPPLSIWDAPSAQVEAARAALAANRFGEVAATLSRAEASSQKANREYRGYVEGTISGAGSAVTALQVTRDTAFTVNAVLATVATGGAAGAAGLIATSTPIAAEVAQQTTEVSIGLRDRIDWGRITVNALVGLVVGRFGGHLGGKLTQRLLASPAFAGVGRAVLARAISHTITGRGTAVIQSAANTAYSAVRGENVTIDRFVDELAGQLSDPRGIFMDVVLGELGHRVQTGRAVPPAGREPAADHPPPAEAPTRIEPAAPQRGGLPRRKESDSALRQQAREEAPLEEETRRAELAEHRTRKEREEQRTEARHRPLAPERAAAANARREATVLYEEARTGKMTHLSEQRKREIVLRFERLASEAGMPVQQRNKMKGNLDESLRTPREAQVSGRAQQPYLAGGLKLPEQGLGGTAIPEYPKTIRAPSGRLARGFVELKSDNIHQMTESQAVSRARKYTQDAIRKMHPLPTGARTVVRYLNRPSPDVQQAMIQEHFSAGSPISEVHFGTTVHRNPNLP